MELRRGRFRGESESGGERGGGVDEGRGAGRGGVWEAVGAAGDAVIIGRDELDRQGINPGAVLGATNGSQLSDPRDADGIADASQPGPDVKLGGQ